MSRRHQKFKRMRPSSDGLGTVLRQARIAAGLSQWDVAERIGVTQASITEYELGKRRPRRATLAALARALGVSADSLLGRK